MSCNTFGSFCAKLLTDRQTDRQRRKHNLLGGGNEELFKVLSHWVTYAKRVVSSWKWCKTEWLGSLVVMALDLRLDGREFDSRPPLLLGWVTAFGEPPGISPRHLDQLSLLSYAGREMSIGQKCSDVLRLGSKGSMDRSTCTDKRMWVAGKSVWCLVNTCQPEHVRNEYHTHYKSLY